MKNNVTTNVLNYYYKMAMLPSEEDRWDISYYIKALILFNNYPEHLQFDIITMSKKGE